MDQAALKQIGEWLDFKKRLSWIYGIYTLLFSLIGFILTLVLCEHIYNLAIVYLIWCVCQWIGTFCLFYALWKGTATCFVSYMVYIVIGLILNIFCSLFMFVDFWMLLFGTNKFESIAMMPQNAAAAFFVFLFITIKLVAEFFAGFKPICHICLLLKEKTRLEANPVQQIFQTAIQFFQGFGF